MAHFGKPHQKFDEHIPMDLKLIGIKHPTPLLTDVHIGQLVSFRYLYTSSTIGVVDICFAGKAVETEYRYTSFITYAYAYYGLWLCSILRVWDVAIDLISV